MLPAGLHIAAKFGKVRSLETILDHIRKLVLSRGGGDIRSIGKGKKGSQEVDEVDDDVGMSAFMHACAGGFYECAKLLHVLALAHRSFALWGAFPCFFLCPPHPPACPCVQRIACTLPRGRG